MSELARRDVAIADSIDLYLTTYNWKETYDPGYRLNTPDGKSPWTGK